MPTFPAKPEGFAITSDIDNMLISEEIKTADYNKLNINKIIDNYKYLYYRYKSI
jgi:hypothetical protein